MIYTVTLNPAIDKTIRIKNFTVDHVNRVDDIREDAGGKGINVSKMIKNLKGESIALGICAGKTGAFIQEQLGDLGITHEFVEGAGQTRTNIKVVDEVNNTFTDINETGLPVTEAIMEAMENAIFSKLKAEDYLVLAGSVPASVPKDIYSKWTLRAKTVGAKVILDADKELLEHGIAAGPYLAKPNIHELEALCHHKIETIDEAIEISRGLLKNGTSIIVISRGSEGSVVVTKDEVLMVDSLKVPVKSTVGAGDSMVAALTLALSQGTSLKEAITLGVAASSASIMKEGTLMGDWETIQTLKEKVTIH